MFDGLADLPRPLVFVFGGGGARGAAQAGQMKALSEAGCFPDAVIGTSVGSISAAVTAEDPKIAATKLVEVWGSMRKANVFPGTALDQVAMLSRTKTHIYSQEALRRTLREHIETIKIEDLQLPYAAVATDYEAAQPTVLQSGSLQNAMAASAAIPGVFPMVEIAGRLLCDGGVVSNVPVIEARLLKPKSLVVLDCIGPVETSLSHIIDIIAGAAGIMMHKQRVADLATVSNDLPVVYMPPPRTAGSPLNFAHTQELIDDTYQSGVEFLENVKIRENPFPALYGEIPSALSASSKSTDSALELARKLPGAVGEAVGETVQGAVGDVEKDVKDL
jgi:NTE family protein